MKYIFILQICFLFISCDKTASQSVIPQIEMNKDYQEKNLFLQDIAEVDYIPLETTDDNLFDGSSTITEISDQGIVVVDQYYNKLCFFSLNGKAIGTLSKKGQGPGEYSHLDAAWINRIRNEVFISDRGQGKLYVYDMKGDFKRSIAFSHSLRQNDIADFDNDHFVSFKDYPINEGLNKSVKPYQPIVLVSKENGNVTDSLPYFKDYIASITIKGVRSGQYRAPQVYCMAGTNIYLTDIGSDTIFSIDRKNGELNPVITRMPSISLDKDGKYFLHLRGATSHFYFLHRQSKEMSMTEGFQIKDEDSHFLMYDRKTNETYCPVLQNKDWSDYETSMIKIVSGKDNYGYICLESYKLLEALEDNKLSGKLKSVAENLKEEDNPVLMVVKFHK